MVDYTKNECNKKSLKIYITCMVLILTMLPTSVFADTSSEEKSAIVPQKKVSSDNINDVDNENLQDITYLDGEDQIKQCRNQVVNKTTNADKVSSNSEVMAAPGPILRSWKNYTVTSRTTKKQFKKICEATNDNRKAKKGSYLKCSITKSKSVGSSWSVSLSASYENKIIAKVGTSYTKTKESNAAVGLSDTVWVPKGKQGMIKAHYKGLKSTGYITYNKIQNNRVIGTEKVYTTQTNHFKALSVHFDKKVW